eukprot:scaffold319807_cov18-Prasinocladus_malaysianus.AAC.1
MKDHIISDSSSQSLTGKSLSLDQAPTDREHRTYCKVAEIKHQLQALGGVLKCLCGEALKVTKLFEAMNRTKRLRKAL